MIAGGPGCLLLVWATRGSEWLLFPAVFLISMASQACAWPLFTRFQARDGAHDVPPIAKDTRPLGLALIITGMTVFLAGIATNSVHVTGPGIGLVSSGIVIFALYRVLDQRRR